jgi:membrane protein required for colicin V production
MLDFFQEFYENISTFDLIYLIITLLSVIKCLRKGFVLSLLAAAKWLLAYVVTLILFPRIKPYVEDFVENEYILDIILGVSIFVIVIFLILMINKGISKAVRYSGLGKLDTVFGFFFGFLRGYIICVCIFSTINIFYNYRNWPINSNKSLTFSYVEKGSNYLIKEFPNEENYKKSKEKIKDI